MERNSASDLAPVYRHLSTPDTSWELAERPGSPDPDDPRWWTGAGLATAPGYAAAYAQTGHDLAVRTGQQPRDYVTATLLLMEYSWCVAGALVGPLLAADTLARPVPGGVTAWFAADETATPCWRIRVTATHADQVDRHAPETLATVRTSFADLMAPVVDAAARHGARRPTGLWRTATDTLATASWAFGSQLDDEQAGVELAESLLADATRPLRGRAGFRRLPLPDGTNAITRERGDCCFYYTLDQPVCVTCPRIDDTERAARLHARQAAPVAA
ncbi:hypothetical protein ACTMSW_25935 [Micromonospora sp. BQ11]|uniref:hypothetical protein n=1 Tax=Micromonospora sp. BQ11 TaxID=3452212 RepID=UPI003F8AEB9E